MIELLGEDVAGTPLSW
jgi:carboxymethylenebutenolidase